MTAKPQNQATGQPGQRPSASPLATQPSELLTVHEVAARAGVTVRSLQHYDRIGLLVPHARSAAGYRLYSAADLARLQQILLFRELEFPLGDIRRILDSPDYNLNEALDQQISLLELKRDHIDGLIAAAKAMRECGQKGAPMPSSTQAKPDVRDIDFAAFSTEELDTRTAEAKARWGATSAWWEYETKAVGRGAKEAKTMGEDLLALFVPFGEMAAAGEDPAAPVAQAQVAAIQSFITEHYYTCTPQILEGLGRMYAAGGDFAANIDAAAGPGAAAFAAQAISAYCS